MYLMHRDLNQALGESVYLGCKNGADPVSMAKIQKSQLNKKPYSSNLERKRNK